LLGNFDYGALWDVIFNDLDHAALAEEGRSVLYNHYLRLDTKYAKKGYFFVKFAVDRSLNAFYFTFQFVFFVVLEVLFDLKLAGEQISLELVEILYIPADVFFEGSVEIKIVFSNDSDCLSQL